MSPAGTPFLAPIPRGTMNPVPRATRLASAVLAMSTCLCCALAQAQSCGAPVEAPDLFGPELVGNTLIGDTSFSGFCGSINASGPVWVYRMRPWSTSTEIRIVEYAGLWNPVLFLVDSSEPCGADAKCLAAGDAGHPLELPTAASRDYWLYVTSADFDAPGSGGAFRLSIDGFPDDPDDPDLIFADGFD
jgi:hypothetical protein